MKILVVEDEKRIANYVKKGLELKSHVVDVCYDGQAGLDFALAEEYDLLILDWMLPGMSGLEICKQLRADDDSTPILMLTARGEVKDTVTGLDAGADDYLPKPFAFEELLARVNALGRRSKEEVTSTFAIDSLVVDPKQAQVIRAGKEVQLSKKEFSLLEFLLRNQGQVFSAQQLAERVWSFDSDVTPNAAQVYIGYIRNKIDKDFPEEKPLITTVRGFGYKVG